MITTLPITDLLQRHLGGSGCQVHGFRREAGAVDELFQGLEGGSWNKRDKKKGRLRESPERQRLEREPGVWLTWVAGKPGFWTRDDVGLLVLGWELPYFRAGWLKLWGPWEGEELPRMGLVGGGGPGSLAFWCQLQWLGCGCL